MNPWGPQTQTLVWFQGVSGHKGPQDIGPHRTNKGASSRSISNQHLGLPRRALHFQGQFRKKLRSPTAPPPSWISLNKPQVKFPEATKTKVALGKSQQVGPSCGSLMHMPSYKKNVCGFPSWPTLSFVYVKHLFSNDHELDLFLRNFLNSK